LRYLKKFRVDIKFELCLGYVLETPYHKSHVANLIAENKIESFVENIIEQEATIFAYAKNETHLLEIIGSAPISKYWNCTFTELPHNDTSF
jgi:hypothetical protein